MRWLAPTLVALALVFSTGGVAIVGHADAGAGDTSEAPESAAPAEQGRCEAPRRVMRTSPSHPRVLKDAAGNKSIVLNTSGYNIALEGEWRPSPVARPQGVPDGVLPDGHDSAPPAAPEAK